MTEFTERGPFGPPLPLVRAHGSYQRILVRLPNWVGDAVMATPALRALRRRFPEAAITAMGRPWVTRLFVPGPLIDRVWPIERRAEKHPGSVFALARALRRERFDAAIQFTTSFGTAIAPWLARIPDRIGYRGEGRRALLSISAPYPARTDRAGPTPMPRLYQGVLDLVGIPPAGPDYERLGRTDAREEVRRWLTARGVAAERPLAIFNPGAAFGASKLWPARHFQALGRSLAALGYEVLVIAGPGEQGIAQAIVQASAGAVRDGSDPLIPLDQLSALFAMAKVVVSTDSGPRHLAVAAGAKVVALIGPTDRRWSDWNLERSRVLTEPVPCGPCHLQECPLDHACLKAITPARVLAAIHDLESSGQDLGP